MMYSSISALKAFAALIIINSHCGELYPISALAKGGALGNSLFFLITGFVLYCPKTGIKQWLIRRYVRLYIPLFIVNFCKLLVNIFTGSVESILKVILGFIYPEGYWFFCALLILYPIYYLIVTGNFREKYRIAAIVLALLYFTVYLFLDKSKYIVETVGFHGIRFSYIFSFFLMLTGAYIRQNIEKISLRLQKKSILLFSVFCLSFGAYAVFIFLMGKYNALFKVQFIETILCIASTVSLFLFFLSAEHKIASFKGNKLFSIIELFGKRTLELYLIQFSVIGAVSSISIPFPLNIALVLIIVFILSVAVGKLSDFLYKKVI